MAINNMKNNLIGKIMKREIFIKTSFSALHNWDECCFDEVDYLKNYHRHTFYVTAYWAVHHNNRDLEFIMTKNKVDGWIRENWEYKKLKNMSCEMMAEKLIKVFGCTAVTVNEDGENGATISL